jgi:transposase-like protein
MAMRVETNPLETAYAVLLEHGLDGAGEALRILVNEAAKVERSEFLGAAPYERTATRRDYANGFKPKTMLTRVGELTFQVPQVRSGDFYPSAQDGGTRTDQAVNLALAEMVVQGVSTRRVIEVLQRLLGPEISLSTAQVSRAAAKLDEGLKAARRAVLPAVPWQRCQFHLQQNAGQFVTRQEARKTVAAQLRTIFNAPDKMEAERLLQSALEAWRKEHPKLAEWAEVAVPESLTVFDFPAAHRVRLRTTRPYTHQPGTATTHPLPASSPTQIPACVWSRPFLPNSTTSETHKVYLNLNP